MLTHQLSFVLPVVHWQQALLRLARHRYYTRQLASVLRPKVIHALGKPLAMLNFELLDELLHFPEGEGGATQQVCVDLRKRLLFA